MAFIVKAILFAALIVAITGLPQNFGSIIPTGMPAAPSGLPAGPSDLPAAPSDMPAVPSGVPSCSGIPETPGLPAGGATTTEVSTGEDAATESSAEQLARNGNIIVNGLNRATNGLGSMRGNRHQ